MKYPRRFAFITILLLAFASPSTLAGSKAHFGFGTEVTISGFFSPKLKRVKISQVIPESPAAKAGLFAGDELLEANDRLIAGAPAREMAGRLNAIKPGEHLRLKVKRQNGTLASIDIIAQ